MAETDGSIEAALRAALIAARNERDARAVAALRSALGAIDNAGALEVAGADRPVAFSDHLAGTAGPLGAGERPRAELSQRAVRSIVEAEIEERRRAAREYHARDQPEAATELLAEAHILERALAAS